LHHSNRVRRFKFKSIIGLLPMAREAGCKGQEQKPMREEHPWLVSFKNFDVIQIPINYYLTEFFRESIWLAPNGKRSWVQRTGEKTFEGGKPHPGPIGHQQQHVGLRPCTPIMCSKACRDSNFNQWTPNLQEDSCPLGPSCLAGYNPTRCCMPLGRLVIQNPTGSCKTQ